MFDDIIEAGRARDQAAIGLSRHCRLNLDAWCYDLMQVLMAVAAVVRHMPVGLAASVLLPAADTALFQGVRAVIPSAIDMQGRGSEQQRQLFQKLWDISSSVCVGLEVTSDMQQTGAMAESKATSQAGDQNGALVQADGSLEQEHQQEQQQHVQVRLNIQPIRLSWKQKMGAVADIIRLAKQLFDGSAAAGDGTDGTVGILHFKHSSTRYRCSCPSSVSIACSSWVKLSITYCRTSNNNTNTNSSSSSRNSNSNSNINKALIYTSARLLPWVQHLNMVMLT